MNKKTALIPIMAFVLIALACGSSPTVVNSPMATDTPGAATATTKPGEPTATTKPDPAKAPALKVGDTGQLGNIKVTVNSAKVVEGDQFNKAKDGEQFIAIDVTFENVGTKPETVSSMLQMELKDSTAQKYDIDFSAVVASGKKAPDGSIPAGDKLRGTVGYAVPKDATGLKWIFKEGFGSNQISYDLGTVK